MKILEIYQQQLYKNLDKKIVVSDTKSFTFSELVTNANINMQKYDDIVWVAEMDCELKNIKDIILFSTYNICKLVLYRKKINKVTGAVPYNFREFKKI